MSCPLLVPAAGGEGMRKAHNPSEREEFCRRMSERSAQNPLEREGHFRSFNPFGLLGPLRRVDRDVGTK
jgi:hypothetical protein